MGACTPATFDSLISCCLEYLRDWPGVISLYLARAINFEQIERLNNHGIKHLNGIIGLGLAAIIKGETSSHYHNYDGRMDWHPLIVSNVPSTIEILAQVELYGANSLAKLSCVIYDDLPLTTRVLIAFSEAKLKSFGNAQDMLASVLNEVERTYGYSSMEACLVGTTLVNCFNRCYQEGLAEGLANSIYKRVTGQLKTAAIAQDFVLRLSAKSPQCTNSELAMVVALADSLLGQGKYDTAMFFYQAVLKKKRPGCEHISMSVALRISKMTRRLSTEYSNASVRSNFLVTQRILNLKEHAFSLSLLRRPLTSC